MKAQFEYFKILIINDKYTSLLLYIEFIGVDWLLHNIQYRYNFWRI